MKIVEYDEVDPLKVIFINQLALDFPLTPERTSQIRQSDPRPFPFMAIYAVDNDIILGQVGVFSLPMVSIEGKEDVGGVWAVSTHPHYAGRGVASVLLEEAHSRMREAGLRFSTLGTDRYRVAYKLYHKHGYEETNVLATALARWETAHQPTRLRAQTSNSDGYDFIERIYENIAQGYLGFARRYTPFAPLRQISLTDIWILRENSRVVGYAITHVDQPMLKIRNVVLPMGIDVAEAVAAISAEIKSDYVQVEISRPVEMISLIRAGFHVAHPSWNAFMLKPLMPEMKSDDAKRLFGIGTDRFLISWMDIT